MKIVYVAGSLRGNKIKKWLNIRKAKKICAYLWKNGVAVYSPHLNSGYIDSPETDDFVMGANIEMLKRCDAIFVMSKWEKSIGTINEMIMSLDLDMPIYFYMELLIDHYKNNKFRNQMHIQDACIGASLNDCI